MLVNDLKAAILFVVKCLYAVPAIAIMAMAVHIMVSVILRTVFHYPVTGTIAVVSDFYMVIAIFIGIFVVTAKDKHIKVDLVENYLPKKVVNVLDVIARLITLLFFLALLTGLIRTAIYQTAQRETVDAIFAHIYVWPMRWVAVIGIGASAMVIIYQLVIGRILGSATPTSTESVP